MIKTRYLFSNKTFYVSILVHFTVQFHKIANTLLRTNNLLLMIILVLVLLKCHHVMDCFFRNEINDEKNEKIKCELL